MVDAARSFNFGSTDERERKAGDFILMLLMNTSIAIIDDEKYISFTGATQESICFAILTFVFAFLNVTIIIKFPAIDDGRMFAGGMDGGSIAKWISGQ